jgi:hypothetical protein
MTEMRKIVFRKGLMDPSLTGDKKIAIKKYQADAHDFVKDEIVHGEFKDGLTILLCITANTKKVTFDQLTDIEAQQDGFVDAEDAFNGLKNCYPDLQKTDVAAIIFYEILSVDDNLVVSINEHAK